jgi:acetyl-CoA synthetase
MTMNLDSHLRQCGFVPSDASNWSIPLHEHVNIAHLTVTRHVERGRGERVALIEELPSGEVRSWTFAQLDALSNQLANALRHLGVQTGQPVGVHLGQSVETALTHLALYKLGAVACTLSQLYGPDTLEHILRDAGLKLLVTKEPGGPLSQATQRLEHPVRSLYAGQRVGDDDFWSVLATGSTHFAVPQTSASQPALMMYTSGSTGHPKGMLHAHRILSAYLPTVRLFYDLIMDREGSVFWTPADWAWVGGLLDLVLPAWAHGQPVVAWDGRFTSDAAFDLMQRHGVTHSFMTPTALKRLAEVAAPRKRWSLNMAVVCTGGEPLPGEVVRWCENDLGAVCNEFYGLTEFNHLVGNCRSLYPIRPGSMGKCYPGHRISLMDENGSPVEHGEVGEIVASQEDPTLFLGYWGQLGIPQSLQFAGGLRTRDLARMDADGYLWYQGRNDDLIKSAGYRIGPAEVEDTLLKHPAVAEAAAVASPDAERGSVVKAFIRLKEGFTGSPVLARELQESVKKELAAYKYPRRIEFVDSFPLTSSGKIRRGELRRRELEAAARGSAETAAMPDVNS